MNPEDYPGAETVVEFCERLKQWDMYVRTAEVEGLDSLVDRMKQSAIDALHRPDGDKEHIEFFRELLAEWEHPNFRAYLAEKLKQKGARL